MRLVRVSCPKPATKLQVCKHPKLSSSKVALHRNIQRPGRLVSHFHTTTYKCNEQHANQQTQQQNNQETQNQQEAQNQQTESQVDPKDQRIKELEQQVLELQKNLKYSLAERENIRIRAQKDVDNAKSYGMQSFAKEVVSVADNLARCIEAVKVEEAEKLPSFKALLEGVQMTEREVSKSFRQFGLERFTPLGEKFDPNKMNAIAYYPDPSKPGNTVAAVFKSGYSLKDRVIRPADVAVVQPQPTESQQNQ